VAIHFGFFVSLMIAFSTLFPYDETILCFQEFASFSPGFKA